MAATLSGAARSRVINKSKFIPTSNTGETYNWPVTMDLVYVYYTCILVFLGIIGNILTVYLLSNEELYESKTSRNLKMFAISNSVYLLCLIPNLLRSTNIIETVTVWNCRIDTYLSLLSGSITSLIIVVFAAENLILKVYPQHNNKMEKLKDIYFNIIGIPIIASMITTAISVQDTYMPNNCNTNSTYLDAPLFNSKNAACSFMIPLVAVVILSIWTVIGKCYLKYKLRHAPNRRQYSSEECVHVWNTLHILASQEKSDNEWNTYNEVNRMMSIVSKTFIVLSLPVSIANLVFDVHQSEAPGRWVALQRVLMMLFNTNFGINFFLYCLSGQNFRQELVRCTMCRRRGNTKPRIVRRDTPRIPQNHAISDDSIATYHNSSAEGEDFTASPLGYIANANEDFECPPPSTPRHEIMELVELGVTQYKPVSQVYVLKI